jgi:type IV secretory pathway VirB10-like protein
MRIFKQKWLKKRMDIACMLFIAGFLTLSAFAQQPPPPVDPQPPRIADMPPATPQRATPRPTPTPAATSAAKPAAPPQTLEQSLTPDLKPMPADPTQRVIENTRRLMQQRQNRAEQNGKDAQPAGRVVVEGGASVTADPNASERVGNILNPEQSPVTSTVLPGGMARQECVTDCVGPACCVIVEIVPQQHKQNPLR